MEHEQVVSESNLEWMNNAPKQIKIDPESDTYNYWVPLTDPVEDSEQINNATEKQVRFKLEKQEQVTATGNKIALKWKRKLANQHERKQVQQQLRADGWRAIQPTGIVDSGASSLCGSRGGAVIVTRGLSSKNYQLPMGQIVSATKMALLQHDLRNPAREIDIVPTNKYFLESDETQKGHMWQAKQGVR